MGPTPTSTTWALPACSPGAAHLKRRAAMGGGAGDQDRGELWGGHLTLAVLASQTEPGNPKLASITASRSATLDPAPWHPRKDPLEVSFPYLRPPAPANSRRRLSVPMRWRAISRGNAAPGTGGGPSSTTISPRSAMSSGAQHQHRQAARCVRPRRRTIQRRCPTSARDQRRYVHPADGRHGRPDRAGAKVRAFAHCGRCSSVTAAASGGLAGREST